MSIPLKAYCAKDILANLKYNRDRYPYGDRSDRVAADLLR